MPTAEIQLHNTLSGKKERFQSLKPGVATLYGCGPTVYGYAHVGNARTSLLFDLVVRTLRLAGYETRFARNITDIDDKIIKVANETGQDSAAVAQKFTDVYLSEMKRLGVIAPDHQPRATQTIPQIVTMIEKLIAQGLAYAGDTPFGKDVYFAVKKFVGYGKLSKRKIDDLLVGARIEPGESKQDPLDFALWKAAKAGEPSWESPWGKGRPGWHIECSAMIEAIFPEGIDLHLGGLDLVFPHHENEIAQSEGCHHGQPLARFWVHGGMLTLQREKMSKSLGNIFTIDAFLKKHDGEVLRLMALQHHYRSPMDFSDEAIHRAEGLLERLYLCKEKVAEQAGAKGELTPELKDLAQLMRDSLFDDFNAAKALGLLLKAVRVCHREQRPELWAALSEGLSLLQPAMGLLEKEPRSAVENLRSLRLKRLGLTNERCQEIEARLQEREEARKRKDFAASDRLRAELESQGVLIMDGPDGSAWTLKEA